MLCGREGPGVEFKVYFMSRYSRECKCKWCSYYLSDSKMHVLNSGICVMYGARLFNSPCRPEIYLPREMKAESDLSLVRDESSATIIIIIIIIIINNYSSRPNRLWGNRGYWIRGHEGERNNCLSKIQLVCQKYQDKTTLASKTRFNRHYFGFQSRRFSLLVGYNI